MILLFSALLALAVGVAVAGVVLDRGGAGARALTERLRCVGGRCVGEGIGHRRELTAKRPAASSRACRDGEPARACNCRWAFALAYPVHREVKKGRGAIRPSRSCTMMAWLRSGTDGPINPS